MLKSLEPYTSFLLATDQVFDVLACLLVVSAAHFSFCELWDFVYYLKYLCFFAMSSLFVLTNKTGAKKLLFSQQKYLII